jgi:hypothetical protein
VAIGAIDDAFFIPLPWGESTQWLRNVLAAGGCTVRWRGRDHSTTDPVVVGIEEAGVAFSPPLRRILRVAGIGSFLRLRRVRV